MAVRPFRPRSNSRPLLLLTRASTLPSLTHPQHRSQQQKERLDELWESKRIHVCRHLAFKQSPWLSHNQHKTSSVHSGQLNDYDDDHGDCSGGRGSDGGGDTSSAPQQQQPPSPSTFDNDDGGGDASSDDDAPQQHQLEEERRNCSSFGFPFKESGSLDYGGNDEQLLQIFCERGWLDRALHVLSCMNKAPSSNTYLSLLKLCNKKKALYQAKQVHAHLALHGAKLSSFLGGYLVMTLAKCGAIEDARHISHLLPRRTVFLWTAMISAYAECGCGQEALKMHKRMQQEGVEPNRYTFVSLFKACGSIPDLEQGKKFHVDARRKGFTHDVFVGTALLSMYGKCGAVAAAEDVFRSLFQRNIVSWNAMLSAYMKQGQGVKALELYRQMQMEHVALNDVTVICVLQASSETGSLEICEQLHFDIVSAGFDQIPLVAATLIHAYGSGANMVAAQVVFDKLDSPDVVSWNACIAGHAGEGNFVASLHMFDKLKVAGIKPDAVTFILVLSACSHTGLGTKGLEYFESMSRDYGLTPNLKHYGIMVDLLGHLGDFKTVENMLGRMPMQADLTMWLCLLGSCRKYGNLELAEGAFGHAVNLQPKQATAYVLLSNIYADAGLHECAAEVERRRLKEGAWLD